jgi:uncharacterized membrane protein YqjE
MSRAADLRGSLRRLGDTLLALLQTRLALFNTELQAGALVAWEALVKAAAAMVLMLVGLVCGIGFIVLACPPEARLWVLGASALLLFAAGIFLLHRARAGLEVSGGPFAASLEELSRDRTALAAERD